MKNLGKEFYEDWEEIAGVSLSFNIFSSPQETINYIIETYKKDLDIVMLEDDLGITKNELL